MSDIKLHRLLMPVLGMRRRRAPDSLRPHGTSRVSRLAAQYDADVDDALRRLWPKARIYDDREFTRDRADFLLVVRGRGVRIETKVKSDPGLFGPHGTRGNEVCPRWARIGVDSPAQGRSGCSSWEGQHLSG
jgi:hypothetical protein